jgi:hypothetical protein
MALVLLFFMALFLMPLAALASPYNPPPTIGSPSRTGGSGTR